MMEDGCFVQVSTCVVVYTGLVAGQVCLGHAEKYQFDTKQLLWDRVELKKVLEVIWDEKMGLYCVLLIVCG